MWAIRGTSIGIRADTAPHRPRHRRKNESPPWKGLSVSSISTCSRLAKGFTSPMNYHNIGDYGIIGDLHTIALVGLHGSIDWCCLPSFDSPSIFGAILDHKTGGHFQISPTERGNARQMYLPETNILLTRFLQQDGVGELTDFMPVESDEAGYQPRRHQIIRMLSVVRGTLRFRLECAPAFNYGRDSHETEVHHKGIIFQSGNHSIGLVSPIKLTVREGMAFQEFTLHEGQTLSFFLEYAEGHSGDRLMSTPASGLEAFHNTSAFWQRWLAQCQYDGRWREVIHRSALTLKLLTYSPTGAIVAAPTTSLPEHIGGTRNWDYRYTWIRDAAFTIYGLLRLGFTVEAGRFMDWLNARCCELNPDGSLQLMYGIDGRRDLLEEELLHLDGHRGSRPVRIGNGAATQLQLDMYGALMDAVYLYNKHGSSISHDLWSNLCRLLDYVCVHWQEPDEGIWEVRGGRRHFVYSKVMCWVALDRGIRLADKRGFPGNRTPLDGGTGPNLSPGHGSGVESRSRGLRPALWQPGPGCRQSDHASGVFCLSDGPAHPLHH
jgi:GH15 family glucan-1,4-alpha-glucosidase